jgi:predicted ATPase
MAHLLQKVTVKNYRSLADVSVDLMPVNVLFGPNGAGKSTFLDVLWFVWDCSVRGVDMACAARGQGLGLLWQGADMNEPLAFLLEMSGLQYELSLRLAAGRIEPFPGERLSAPGGRTLFERKPGSPRIEVPRSQDYSLKIDLREPDKLGISRYLDSLLPLEEPDAELVVALDELLRLMHFLHARSFSLYDLKKHGSEASHEIRIGWNGQNLWSVLRNLHDRQRIDDRYETIMRFMTRCFPSFDGLAFEQTGAGSLYGLFVEKGRQRPIAPLAISDGHLQMLLLLAALFSEGRTVASVLLLDEPELSLHPWALAVLAEAVKFATVEWNKQVFIATHSPVLLSQFDAADSFAVERREGRTHLKRVSEIEGIEDLLQQYAMGALYMAELVAPQHPGRAEAGGKGEDD